MYLSNFLSINKYVASKLNLLLQDISDCLHGIIYSTVKVISPNTLHSLLIVGPRLIKVTNRFGSANQTRAFLLQHVKNHHKP